MSVTPPNSDKANGEPEGVVLDETPETPAEADQAAESEPESEPEHQRPGLVEPEPVSADTAAVASAVAEPLSVADTTGTVEPTVVPTTMADASSVPAQHLVYVLPPVPPKTRGNRVVGVLLAILGGALFAGVYTLASAFILKVQGGDFFGLGFVSFVSSAFFWVPVAAFLLALILLVLVLNRAGWWAHVFGSLILAIAVYFGVIGLLLLIGNVFHASPTHVAFAGLALNPWVIASAIIAREVSIWTGLGIAARGRRVKARNVEAMAAFDREQEAKRAEYARTGTGVGV